MSLLLAPYTNAMRLGQGFNTYTQQICVDDAVVIDPARSENVVTNDGTTMRIVAEMGGKPSAWNRIREVVNEGPVAPAGASTESAPAAIEAPAARPAALEAAPAADSAALADAESPEDVPQADAAAPAADAPAAADAAADPVEEGPAATETGDAAPADDSVSDTGSAVKVDAEPVEPAETAKPSPTATGAAAKDAAATPARNRSSSVGNKQAGAVTKPVPAKYQTKEIPVRGSKPAAAPTTPAAAAPKPKPMDEFEAEQARLDRVEKLELMKQEKERMAEQRAYQRQMETEKRDEERVRRDEDRKEQSQLREEKRRFEAARREAAQKAIADAAAKNANALTLEDLNKIKAQNQFADRFDGMVQDNTKYTFDASASRGTSQTVIYSSRFIDKLSDVTDDMCISGALSVKMAKIGGSGRGSFVDSDKFKESDLNFYISVKVVNQTINFKDALVYNPMRSVSIGSDDFNKVYGDSFVSGFVEGGEFNAIVSMKVHNKAKLLDIKAEAKVALTAGPVDITAEANVGIARTNLEMNTETTIQVSWCGGGNIKPMEQPWNIGSIMEAAARFPELVSGCPQRTHAILTKYDALRSFVSLRPASFSPIQYENAQIYTNVLMDAFMSYKSLYKKLGDQVFSIQSKTLEFEPWEPIDEEAAAAARVLAESQKSPTMKDVELKAASAVGTIAAEAKKYLAALTAAADTSRFEASLKGISDARKFIRRQMVYIVNEVDLIEKDPKIATDQDHDEPFQSPLLFESRLPATKIPDRLKPKSDPLSGRRIMAKTQTEAELEEEQKEQEKLDNDSPALYRMDQDLLTDETSSLDEIRKKVPMIGKHLQVSTAAPKTEKGALFNNLDFLYPEWQVETITVGVREGRVVSVEVIYENGLILRKGMTSSDIKYKTLANFQAGERILSAAIEVGEPRTGSDISGGSNPKVLSICMYTNRGRRLLGQAVSNEVLGGGLVRKDGFEYEKVHTTYLDSAYSAGTFKGFFGRVDPDPTTGGILRLGLIWGDSVSQKTLSTTVADVAPIYDIDASTSEATVKTFRDERDAARREAEEQRNSAQAAARTAESSLQDFRSALESEQRQSQDARGALQQMQSQFERERAVAIVQLSYGGQDYSNNETIVERLRDIVLNYGDFTPTNDFFAGDPTPGQYKSAGLWYKRRGQGLKAYVVNEGTSQRME